MSVCNVCVYANLILCIYNININKNLICNIRDWFIYHYNKQVELSFFSIFSTK